MCKILRKTVIPVLSILMPVLSMATFWLGSKGMSPTDSLSQSLLYLGVMAYDVLVSMGIVCYWHKIEQILLLGDAVISHQAYGSQRLLLRVKMRTPIIGLIFAIIVQCLGYVRAVFCWLILPLTAIMAVAQLALLGYVIFSLRRIRRYGDGLITVCRCPAAGQTSPTYEGWTIADAKSKLYLTNSGYAMTIGDECDLTIQELLQRLRQERPES